jgi:uncharacterized oxidoreductase
LLLTGRRLERVAAVADQIKTSGGEAHAFTADVAAEDGPARTLAVARDVLGGIDVLINNAGGVRAGRLPPRQKSGR